MNKLIFPRKLRLLNPKDFDYVFQYPKKVFSSEIIIFGRTNTLRYPRIGFTIAKKNIKLSHDRNRIKRLVREYFRLHRYKLPSMDFVILVKKSIVNLNNEEITKKLGYLWCRHSHLARKF
ncbi:ribonuclease P protein component [Arsenophonus symbiont of Ornithomya chloropus]|uniref:ribonuclease P protein component n=1 Tax=Arsenophonus symbiont of Ornithomya chloropus TaxID=634121 RepID=UPI0032B15206